MARKFLFSSMAILVTLAMVLAGCNGGGNGEEPLPSEYIGSGQLDGDGIPVDFFEDIDVRKAFCYAFNYDTYIADALNGQGVQRGSPVVEGLYGYYDGTPMYSYCLTKAVEHMQAAWDGEAWEKGFKFTLLYNAGNLPRKTACELISEAWAGIGADYADDPEKFQVSIQALSWPTMLGKIFGTRDMPMFQIGWLPDYPHADNFLYPFMHSQGVFSHYQGYGDATTDAAIAAAFEESDYATQMGLYADLQEQYYNDAPGIVLAQPIVRRYFTQHIDGFYYNPVESSYAGRVLDLSKSENATSPIPYKNDGSFVFETIGDIYSLDPAWIYDTASGMQVGMINEQLLYYDGNSTEDFQPLLATGWSFNDTHYRFTIRDNVQFSNGYNLTPEDVEYTFERAMCQDRPGGPIWMFYAMMLGSDVGHYEDTTFAEIDAAVEVDGNDVVFKVADPAWEIPFLQIMSGQWAGIVSKQYCQDIGDWDGTEGDVENFLHPENPGDIPLYDVPVGTGPWELQTWDQGIQIILEDNDLYWGGAVPFDEVITKVVDEWSTRKLDLLAGEADLVYVPASRFVEMEPEEPDLQVFKDLPSLSIDAFFFNFIIGGPEE